MIASGVSFFVNNRIIIFPNVGPQRLWVSRWRRGAPFRAFTAQVLLFVMDLNFSFVIFLWVFFFATKKYVFGPVWKIYATSNHIQKPLAQKVQTNPIFSFIEGWRKQKKWGWTMCWRVSFWLGNLHSLCTKYKFKCTKILEEKSLECILHARCHVDAYEHTYTLLTSTTKKMDVEHRKRTFNWNIIKFLIAIFFKSNSFCKLGYQIYHENIIIINYSHPENWNRRKTDIHRRSSLFWLLILYKPK